MKKIYLVPHTHWDREWYLPFERYRYFMVQLVDDVLALLDEEEDYRHFLLDGQAILLEDYLEIKPEEEHRLRQGISDGRIGTGPWYTMPDEFLVSGEGLIRNLMFGHRTGMKFGGVMKVGYLPDPFGHVSQMPQILRGFGIEVACMSRGVDWPQSEFWWEAPDGSRVLTHWFSQGYSNARWLTEDPDCFQFREHQGLMTVLEVLGEKATTDVLLLMNGNDHLGPQPGIPEIIRKWNEELELEIFQGSLEEFFGAVAKSNPRLLTLSGEMRSARHFPILPNVMSSRIYLKQRNYHLQKQLEGYAEPIAAFTWVLGEEYPEGFLRQAWKLLLQNHFHDSICASSVDQVHREMMMRFDRVDQISASVIEDSMRRLAKDLMPAGEEKGIFVFNSAGQFRSGIVDVWVEVKGIRYGQAGEILWENRLLDENFSIQNPEGKPIPYQICERRLAPGDILQGEVIVESWRLKFMAHDIPAFGTQFYGIASMEEGTPEGGTLLVDERGLENEFYKVQILEDGSLEVFDKTNEHTYSNLGYFEDSGDSGDEYNYNPPDHQEVLLTLGKEAIVSVLEDEPEWGTLRVTRDWELPLSLAENRRARSEERVVCEIYTDITLRRGVQRIDFLSVVNNQAKDHRLRVVFPSGLKPSDSIAQTPFAFVRRPVELQEGTDWAEMPSPTHPTGGYVVAEGEGRGVAVFSKGLPEYELTEEGEIILTLLRCVGWLSRPDLKTRPSNAGPPFETPEAQCQGEHVFEYAIMPFEGTWIEDGNFLQAQQFDLPLAAIDVQDGTSLEWEQQMLRLEPMELVVSTLKRAERGEALILRLYNLSHQPQEAKLELPFAVTKAYEVNLLEEESESLDVEGSEVKFYVRGAEIKTIKIYT
jgi:mannosylglycerate hydrolase